MAKEFNAIRTEIMSVVENALTEYDVLHTGSQELCLPIVNEKGEEGYLVITFKVPKGSRDGDAYDGYEMAQDYARKCEEKARKAKENAEKKAKKIARDTKAREKKGEK